MKVCVCIPDSGIHNNYPCKHLFLSSLAILVKSAFQMRQRSKKSGLKPTRRLAKASLRPSPPSAAGLTTTATTNAPRAERATATARATARAATPRLRRRRRASSRMTRMRRRTTRPARSPCSRCWRSACTTRTRIRAAKCCRRGPCWPVRRRCLARCLLPLRCASLFFSFLHVLIVCNHKVLRY